MTGNHQPVWKFSFCMNSTYYVVVQKTGTFFWVTQTHVYSSKLIPYLDWPIWWEHQVYCPIPRLTHTTPPFINQSVSLYLHVHKQWRVIFFFFFFVLKVTFIDLYLAFCVKFQCVALKGIFYSSLVCLQYYYLKYCVACSNEVVVKNKSGIKIPEDKFTLLSVWHFANHRSEIPSGQQRTYIKQSLLSCVRCKKNKIFCVQTCWRVKNFYKLAQF